MKDNWKKKKLGNLVTFQKGKISEQATHPRKGFAPIINTDALRGDIKVWGKIKDSVTCDSDNVLILWDGERSGLSAIGYNGVLGSTFSKMVVSSELNPDFLFRYVDFNYNWIQGQRTGTGVPHVPKNLNSIFIVNYPPLPHQKKIANILSTCDAVIEQTEVAIAKYQALKQGMMHDLFTRGIDTQTGKLRPKYQDAPELYKESELEMIPLEWEVGVVKDLLKQNKSITYGIVQPGDYVSNGIYMIRSQDYTKGWNGIETIMQVHPIIDKPYERSRVYSGDILITVVGANVGRMAIVPDVLNKANISRSVARIAIDHDKADCDYCYYYLKSQITKILFANQVGGAQPVINLKSLELFNLVVPSSKEEQLKISEIITKMDDKLETEQSTLAKYQQLKSGLMQDLLSGKVEVSVMENELSKSN